MENVLHAGMGGIEMSEWIEYVKKLFSYDKDTGKLTWKVSKGAAKKGTEAGNNHTNKGKQYRYVMIDGKSYSSHRIIWLMVYGCFPKNDIDHINGNGLDNRIENLRDATTSENCRNRKIPSNNKSGIIGVSWEENVSKWRARIRHDGKLLCLGLFENLQDAEKARKNAEIKYGYHENHGKKLS